MCKGFSVNLMGSVKSFCFPTEFYFYFFFVLKLGLFMSAFFNNRKVSVILK